MLLLASGPGAHVLELVVVVGLVPMFPRLPLLLEALDNFPEQVDSSQMDLLAPSVAHSAPLDRRVHPVTQTPAQGNHLASEREACVFAAGEQQLQPCHHRLLCIQMRKGGL
jgi:hypothetical protein